MNPTLIYQSKKSSRVVKAETSAMKIKINESIIRDTHCKSVFAVYLILLRIPGMICNDAPVMFDMPSLQVSSFFW